MSLHQSTSVTAVLSFFSHANTLIQKLQIQSVQPRHNTLVCVTSPARPNPDPET